MVRIDSLEGAIPQDAEVASEQSMVETLKSVATTASPQEMREVLDDVPDAPLEAIDLLARALVFEHLDRASRVARSRDQVNDLLGQLSATTHLVTSMASILNLATDRGPVSPSRNFVEWDAGRLNLLARHMLVRAEQVSRDGEIARREVEDARHQQAAVKENLDKVKAQTSSDSATHEAVADNLREQVRTLNRMLGGYHDQETYLVARVDPVTGAPERFFSEEADRVVGHRTPRGMRPLSRVQARELRVSVMRVLRRRADKVDRMSVSRSVAIMQMSLLRVRPEEEDE